MAGYLFVHFIGEQKDGEQIYFSVSKDGLHWQDLNGYRPVLYSRIGELGVRDPFCVRDEKNGKFYLIATDLRIEAGKGWNAAQHQGSRDLIVWESEDLVHWSAERSVTVGIEGAGCVWAPEAIWDTQKEAFFVFWASMVKEAGDAEPKQRIYGSWTKDFKEFTPAVKYLEKDCHVIDTTMIFAEGMYYRFSKDETTKRICMEKAASLADSAFTEVESELLAGLYGVEGPEIYALPDGRYCLIVDQFAAGKGYLPLVTDALGSGRFEELPKDSYDLGTLKKRHGGVVKITEEEYDRLVQAFDRQNPVLPGLAGCSMKIRMDTTRRGEALGDLYGIFFEDLNHAADGGLYAELVENRAFEFDPIDHPSYTHLTGWEKVERDGSVRLAIETGNPVSGKNPHYLAMDITEPGQDVGVCNRGYHGGIFVEAGASYRFSCYAKREQCLQDALTVSLRDEAGALLVQQQILLSGQWKKYELELSVPETAADSLCSLALTAQGRGKVYLDFVSLFPKETYRGRANGMRRDIAKLLEELHPKFVRFPGGCLVHDGALDPNVRDAQYRWKNTVGVIENRPARRSNWGYHQTLGLGFYEYFQFCEDIGAKPLPVISPGYDPHHHREAPLDQMQYFVDEALDLIEFANGPADSVWGGLRADMGHPEPFGMEYLGIGNEEVGEAFFDRFRVVYQAVRTRYPRIKVIGTSGPFAAGGEYERGWRHAKADRVDLVDEHYYQSPEWFLANQHRYDSFSEDDPKVFLGEYASWGNTWWNALCEASYMLGLERNAKAVGLACYAPLLCSVNHVNWKPDMIWFDAKRSFGTANYYVQKLFMENQGSHILPVEVTEAPEPECLTPEPERISGELWLSGDDAQIRYRDIVLRNEDTGEEKRFRDCTAVPKEEIFLTATQWENYTLRMKATEETGSKGFVICFGRKDADNAFFWTLGGWQNQDTSVTEKIAGRSSDLGQYLFSVESGREYELTLSVRGRRVQTFVDGNVIQDLEAKPVWIEPLYVGGALDANGDILVKAVNVSAQEKEAELVLKGLEPKEYTAVRTLMCGWDKDAQNSFEQPAYVSPKTDEMRFFGDHFSYRFPAESITVLRIRK